MISLGTVAAAGAATYYAADNYFSRESGTNLSTWMGRGAERLSLSGSVDTRCFEAILAGRLPDGSVIEARNGEHRPGLDMTFSAPKSVSLLALLGKDERIVTAFRHSVAASLKWAEINLAETRTWDGTRQVTERSGNFLAAAFTHDVNRSVEPQLHIHLVIANATLAADGKWHAIKNDQLYQHRMTLAAVHNAYLREALEKLGYETEPARNPIAGSFEVKGFTREQLEAFSSRRAEILATLAKENRSSPRERELAALATRQDKQPNLSAEEKWKVWKEKAAEVGLDTRVAVEAAFERAGRGETIWDRVVTGFRGIHAKGLALAAAMGLSPSIRDEMVPERKGALAPREFAAALATASAIRDLGEREAGFDKLMLLRTALERRGPLNAELIEARIALLQNRGLLLGEDRLVTTKSALVLEQAAIAQMQAGKGAALPFADRRLSAVKIQEAAAQLGMHKLNPGQLGAAVDILASRDRLHLVQGGAGVGKSSALAPVSAVVRGAGKQVHALAVAKRTATEFGERLGVEGKSIASFLAKYRPVLDGSASAEQLQTAKAELSGSYICVDETSMVGTTQFEQILRLSNSIEAERVVMAGDVRQLLAIDSGKPFEQAQGAGATTSHVTENLRATSPRMKEVVAALDRDDVPGAFAALGDRTIELPRQNAVQTAANMWSSLPNDERENTLLLTLSRSMRADLNAQVQADRLANGELGRDNLHLTVLDRATITKEGARQSRAYREGRLVIFESTLRSQGIQRGERGRVMANDGEVVALKMQDGRTQIFEPERLPYNLKRDAVSVCEEKPLTLHAGDRIRWTTNDQGRGLSNSDLARVESIGTNSLTISTRQGELVELKSGDPMLERLDLAYAVNVHIAQGMTADRGIMVMSETEKQLNSARSFLVAATRFKEDVTLIVDSAKGLERGVLRNPGDKTSALDVATGQRRTGESEADDLKRKLGFEDSRADLSQVDEFKPGSAKVDLPERNIERSR